MAGEVLAAEHVPTWRLHRLFDKAGAPRCAAKPPPVRGLPPRPRRAGAASRAVPFAGAHRHTARRSHAGRQPRCRCPAAEGRCAARRRPAAIFLPGGPAAGARAAAAGTLRRRSLTGCAPRWRTPSRSSVPTCEPTALMPLSCTHVPPRCALPSGRHLAALPPARGARRRRQINSHDDPTTHRVESAELEGVPQAGARQLCVASCMLHGCIRHLGVNQS